MLSKCNIGVQTGVVVYYLVLKTTQQKLEKFEDLIDVRYEWWLEFNFLKKHCDLSIHYPQRERERELGCTDAALEAPHLRPTRRRTRDAADRASGHFCHVVSFFFRRLAPTWLRLGLIRVESCWFVPTREYRPKSAKPPKWPVQVDSGRNSNTLSHSVTHLSSLCSLRCACARLHWITLCLSVSALCLGVSTTTQHKCYSIGPWQRVAI